jgi:hypothetical protein
MHMTFGRLGAVDAAAKMSGMEGALPATWRLPALRLPPLHVAAFWLVLGLVNAWFVGWSLVEIALAGWSKVDWVILQQATAASQPYADTLYRWSPLLLGPLALLTAMPFGVWAALHVAAALALPSWPLRLLTLASWPFWQDTSNGNVMVLVLLVAVYALRGHRWAQYGFLALTLLMPRPLMLPVAAWLLWRHSDLRVPFVIVTVAYLSALPALDPQWAWFGKLLTSGNDVGNSYNVGPSAMIGAVWVPIGAVLAVILTWKGRLGLASLAASPYWLPYYMLMGLLELPDSRKA